MDRGRREDVPARQSWSGVVGLWIAALFLAVIAGFGAWWTARSGLYVPSGYESAGAGLSAELFAARYPANERFQTELQQLRAKGKLTPENEGLIDRSITTTARELQVPPALLWCLLFQESRLDHLLGIEAQSGATGLGQFLFSSFYEVNFHLDRYSRDNVEVMSRLLGGDPRPIGAFKRDTFQISSYYYIPTAVAASAVYLNNRYHQLSNGLTKRNIPFHRDLLWLYATMAYNKGARSVYSFWNAAREEGGWRRVESLVAKPSAFFEAVTDARHFRPALERIWPKAEAANFAREVKIHLEKIRACSIADSAPAFLDEQRTIFRETPEGKKGI